MEQERADELRAKVTEAYCWYRALGNRASEGPHCRLVVDEQWPDIWVANHVQHPRAQTDAEIDVMFAAIERTFVHCDHRLIMADAFTPDALIARLLSDGYAELDATIQMVLDGPLARVDAPPMTIRRAEAEGDWTTLYGLMREDHGEGARSHHLDLADEITLGLVRDIQRKAGASTMYLAELDGQAVAYAAGVDCANGLGLIEDVFTLPDYRGRGVASGLVAHAIGGLRMDDPRRPIFLGAHARQKAKHLYRGLGFVPLAVTREFLRERV